MFPDLLENMFCRHKFDSIPFNNSHLYTQCQYSDSQWLLMPLFLSDLTAQLTYLLHIRQRWARLGETPAGWSYEEEAARLNAVTLRMTPATKSSFFGGWWRAAVVVVNVIHFCIFLTRQPAALKYPVSLGIFANSSPSLFSFSRCTLTKTHRGSEAQTFCCWKIWADR